MENTLFMREILAVKRMADEGVLGDIIYMRGGYRHDLRNIMLDDHGNLGGRIGTESVWRSRFYTSRNGDLYPTHGLAPLCLILGVGKRDRLVALTSFATKAVGMRQRMIELEGQKENEKKRKKREEHRHRHGSRKGEARYAYAKNDGRYRPKRRSRGHA